MNARAGQILVEFSFVIPLWILALVAFSNLHEDTVNKLEAIDAARHLIIQDKQSVEVNPLDKLEISIQNRKLHSYSSHDQSLRSVPNGLLSPMFEVKKIDITLQTNGPNYEFDASLLESGQLRKRIWKIAAGLGLVTSF